MSRKKMFCGPDGSTAGLVFPFCLLCSTEYSVAALLTTMLRESGVSQQPSGPFGARQTASSASNPSCSTKSEYAKRAWPGSVVAPIASRTWEDAPVTGGCGYIVGFAMFSNTSYQGQPNRMRYPGHKMQCVGKLPAALVERLVLLH